jgi:hypothetical protein
MTFGATSAKEVKTIFRSKSEKRGQTNMTVKEIQARLEILRQSIQDQLRAFQEETETKVHSVQVNHDSGKIVVTVKVQIPA